MRKERKRDNMIFWQTGETGGIFSFPLILRIYLEDFDQNLPKSRPGPTTILPLGLIESETWIIDQQQDMSLHGVGFIFHIRKKYHTVNVYFATFEYVLLVKYHSMSIW
jgi:hypothetical protein